MDIIDLQKLNIEISETKEQVDTLEVLLELTQKVDLDHEVLRHNEKLLEETKVKLEQLVTARNSIVHNTENKGARLLAKINSLCKKHFITVAELERALNLSNGSIRRWGSSLPSVDKVAALADHFNVSLDYLMDRTPSSGEYLLDNVLSKDSKVIVPFFEDAYQPESSIEYIELSDGVKKILLLLSRNLIVNDPAIIQQTLEEYDSGSRTVSPKIYPQ